MKKLLLFSSLTATLLLQAQRPGIHAYANFDMPDKHIMPNMSTAYGAGVEFMLRASKKLPLLFTAAYSGGYYAYKTVNTTYYFTDGSTTKTDVNYSSALNKFTAGFRYAPSFGECPLIPYVSLQGGFTTMVSRIFIEDPADAGGCEALENKNVFSRPGYIYMAGGGLQLNTKFFGHKVKHGSQHIDIGLYFTGGSRIDYININHMKDQPQGPASHTGSSSSADVRDYYAPFVNVSTNSIHEHKIAEVYTTRFGMWNLRAGYTFQF